MNMRSYAVSFMESLTKMELKSKEDSSYAKRVNKYLEYMNSISIDASVQIVFDVLSKCIDVVRRSKDEGLSLHRREIMYPNYFAAALGEAIDMTIKENKYNRWDKPLFLETKLDLIDEISTFALQLPYKDMVNFIGELSGAWILTYPVELILKHDHVTSAAEWAKEELDYIYLLRRYFEVEFDEWRR